MYTLAEIADSQLVRLLGLFVFIRLVYRAIYSLAEFTINRLSPLNFKKYGEWVVVTGSTDGIGKALSKEFAERGMNIVLVSRSEEKLRQTAKEIESEYQDIKTLCVQADFKNRDCYSNIEKAIQNLDVGILVNNVGCASETMKPYTKYSTEELWNTLDVNCGSAMIMSRMILPEMRSKKRGMIVNVSSLSSEVGLPGFGIYAATKSFLQMFSLNLQNEILKYNIKVYCFTPGLVKTKIIDVIGEPVRKELPPIIAPDASQFSKWAIRTLTSQSIVITGYWGHTLLSSFMTFFPIEARIKGMTYLYNTVLKISEERKLKK